MGGSDVDALLAGVLVLVLMFATREDMLSRRIPNVLVAIALLLGVSLQTIAGGWAGALSALSGALTGLSCLLPFYVVRGMGAGDVKLMAAVGSFIGPLPAVLAAALTLVMGGVVAVALPMWRAAKEVRSYACGTAQQRAALTALVGRYRHEQFPYAVAIAGGTLIVLWYQGRLHQLAAMLTG